MPISTEYPPLTATQRIAVRRHAGEAKAGVEQIQRLLNEQNGGADVSAIECTLADRRRELAGMLALLAR
jgi:hypothetical protein